MNFSMRKKKLKTSYNITLTAMLLAVILLFQSLRIFFPFLKMPLGPFDLSTLLIGTLVNLGLIVSVNIVGVFGASVIAILTPIIAFMQGHLPIPQMILTVAVGNLVLVYSIFLLDMVLNNSGIIGNIINYAISGFLKFGAMFLIVRYIIIPLFVTNTKLKGVLSAGFSYPQLVTAYLGSIIAIMILPIIKKAMSNSNLYK